MLTPEDLFSHARRLLAGQPDEADVRRAVSAFYYVVFNTLIASAAELQPGSPLVQDATRRSIQHRDARRVCESLAARPASRPAGLQRLLVEPVDRRLVAVAEIFNELQEARLKADYDLAATIPLSDALGAESGATTVLGDWPALLPNPNTQTFLLAILFFDRWTRRA